MPGGLRYTGFTMPKLGFIGRILGDSNDRELKRIQKLVDEINDLSAEMEALTDEQLRDKKTEFMADIEAGETTDGLLPEAFAVVREVAKRQVGERPFDVQLMGGITLHEGRIAEMRTGEGKTLTAISPLYLNALEGRGVHLITVNDYLARYQAVLYGPVYTALGMRVGIIQNNFGSFMYEPGWDPEENEGQGLPDLRPCERREVYAADITYGTNNEFGFDYLRDNMVINMPETRAARAQLRHRRRSGLHPHRRGAHAAHHQRPGRRGEQHVHVLRPRREATRRRRRLHGRLQVEARCPHR